MSKYNLILTGSAKLRKKTIFAEIYPYKDRNEKSILDLRSIFYGDNTTDGDGETDGQGSH